jgi:dipeptidyl aminopeptidase/acylaminoacyl peptidase
MATCPRFPLVSIALIPKHAPRIRYALSSVMRLLAFALSVQLDAQMQPHARFEGEMLPIATYAKDYLNVLKDGKRRQTRDMHVEVRPAPDFGTGFVTVSDVAVDLDPLRNATLKEKARPSAIRFRYRASVTADRPLTNCYALLTTVTEGSLGIHLIAVGRLSPGQAKTVEKELFSKVDSVASLHVFSEGLEVRSNFHPGPYDMNAFYAEATRSQAGLSAVELIKFDDIHPHTLSHDGRLLATVRTREAKKILIVYDLVSMQLLAEAPTADADEKVDDLHWVSDHEIAFIATDDRETALHMFDVKTGSSRELKKEVHAIISQVTDQPEILAVIGGRWAELFYKFNARAGKVSDMQEPSSGAYLFDRQGHARIRIRHHGDNRTYYAKPKPDGRWQNLDDLVRQPGLKFAVKGADMLDRVADVQSMGPDGDTIYISSRLGSDRFEIAAFSMSEGVIKKTIAKHPRNDLNSSDGGLARLLFSKRSARLLGFVFETQKPQIVWLEPAFASAQKQVDATFPGHVNLPVDWTDDARTLIFFSSSDQDPGTYYVYQPLESRLIPLLELGARLRGKTLARTTAIEFQARDGQVIPAYLTRPTKPGQVPPPLLVSIHGGPMARDSWQFSSTNQFFASRGYAILQVNYRGSSGYGATFQNAGLRARLDTVILDDIADGVRHLIAQGDADPGRVAVMGASFGGWATYLSLIKYPDIYRVGIATAAVSHWRKTLSDDRNRFDNRIAYTFWKSLLSREDFATTEKFIDPYLRAGELKQPVLIMHGERDRIVHATESRLMLDALRRNNPNVRARSFPNATHSYWPVPDRIIWLNEVAAFLEQHLPSASDTR